MPVLHHPVTCSQASWTWGVLQRDILVPRAPRPHSFHPSAKEHGDSMLLCLR